MKQKLLLHACCGPCVCYITELLKDEYDLTLAFYGPNIHPKDEYDKRLESFIKFTKITNNKYVVFEYNKDDWFFLTKGFEKDPEGGARCLICHRMRLKRIAEYAKKNDFDYFSTSITTGPNKFADIINNIGSDFAKEFNIKFLDADFKKKDGFKKSCKLSKEYGLYRQNYCGCIFSEKTRVNANSNK